MIKTSSHNRILLSRERCVMELPVSCSMLGMRRRAWNENDHLSPKSQVVNLTSSLFWSSAGKSTKRPLPVEVGNGTIPKVKCQAVIGRHGDATSSFSLGSRQMSSIERACYEDFQSYIPEITAESQYKYPNEVYNSNLDGGIILPGQPSFSSESCGLKTFPPDRKSVV